MLNCCLDTSHGNTPRAHSQESSTSSSTFPANNIRIATRRSFFPQLIDRPCIGTALTFGENFISSPQPNGLVRLSTLSSAPKTVAGFFCCQLCADFSPPTNHLKILQCVRSSYIRRIFSRLSSVTPVTRLAVIPPPIPRQL